MKPIFLLYCNNLKWKFYFRGRHRCGHYNSDACLSVLYETEDGRFIQYGDHNHGNDDQAILNLEALNWCKSEAVVRAVTLQTIFDEAAVRYEFLQSLL